MNLARLLLFPLVASTTLPAAPPPGLGPEAQKAYALLKEVNVFSSTSVGVAGTTPESVSAFRTLLAGPHASTCFKTLLEEATTAGQLYALCGLWFTDPAAFKAGIEKHRRSDAQVETLEGCIASRQPVREVIESKATGAVRLRDNQQTIRQWTEEHRPKTLHYDILGGAWPSMFRDEGGFRKPAKKMEAGTPPPR